MLDFLGFGLTRPFQRDARDFAAAGGEQLVRSAVGQVLGTVGASEITVGELPWSEFGSLLHRLRHQKNDVVLQELGRVYVVDALKRWEPRIKVRDVRVRREHHDGENVLLIALRYDLVSSDTAANDTVISNIDQSLRM